MAVARLVASVNPESRALSEVGLQFQKPLFSVFFKVILPPIRDFSSLSDSYLLSLFLSLSLSTWFLHCSHMPPCVQCTGRAGPTRLARPAIAVMESVYSMYAWRRRSRREIFRPTPKSLVYLKHYTPLASMYYFPHTLSGFCGV